MKAGDDPESTKPDAHLWVPQIWGRDTSCWEDRLKIEPIISMKDEQKEYAREHKAVLRAIRELKCSDEFRGEHFSPSDSE